MSGEETDSEGAFVIGAVSATVSALRCRPPEADLMPKKHRSYTDQRGATRKR
jgi:hypothetical protein